MTEAEKPRSVLVAELSGKVRLHEKLGSSEALRAVARCTRRMERAIESGGGRIVKSADDRLIAVFGPADGALRAAIEMQQRVGGLPSVSGVKLAVRVGLAHGQVGEQNEVVVGAAFDLAARLAALASAGQILTDGDSRGALSADLQAVARVVAAADDGKAGAAEIFEIVAAFMPTLLVKALIDPEAGRTAGEGPILRLSYGGQQHTLDDTRPVITMGRGVDNHVIVNDRRASRNHARIERRGEQIVVLDSSSNGTYVSLQGKPELCLRKEDCVIRGKGVICFAASSSDAHPDCAEFEVF